MKVYESIPFAEIDTKDLVSEPINDIDLKLLHISLTRHTRIHKIEGKIKEFIDNIASIESLKFGVFIRGRRLDNNDLAALLPLLEVSSHNIIGLPHDLSTLSRNVVSNTHIYIDSTIKPIEYEKLFAQFQSERLRGVCFDIESITRGYVALAHRFNLKITTTDLLHERHEQKAIDSGCDECVIEYR